MVFDLQRFDDEQAVNAAPQSTPESNAETQAPIPEELEGIPEDIARDAMSEWEATQAKTEAEQQPAPVTYSQDDYQAKVNEVEQLKAQLAQYQRQQPQAQQPQIQQPQPPPTFEPPPIKITPEISAKINEVIKEEAKAMASFTDDDVASLDYADDDDPRLSQWAQAKSLAQAKVIKAINDARAWQQRRAQQFYNEHTAAINDYNEFAQKAMAEPDFKAIQQYATNDLFNALSPNEQKILANSYLRVERNTASPAEMLVVKNYYERAKTAYRGRNAKQTSTKTHQNQRVTMPRIDQVGGAAGTGEITVDELEKMLDTTEFDKLPEPYQKRLLGY